MVEEVFLGQDLDLGFVADEEGWVFAGPYTRVDLQARERQEVAPRAVDLGLVGGRANLVQSLVLRLKTERGELAGMGHPDYGSRHHQLVGQPNTENNRNLVKLYVLECLRGETRLERILEIKVEPVQGRENRDKIKIELTAKIRGDAEPLSLVVPFSFEGGLT